MGASVSTSLRSRSRSEMRGATDTTISNKVFIQAKPSSDTLGLHTHVSSDVSEQASPVSATVANSPAINLSHSATSIPVILSPIMKRGSQLSPSSKNTTPASAHSQSVSSSMNTSASTVSPNPRSSIVSIPRINSASPKLLGSKSSIIINLSEEKESLDSPSEKRILPNKWAMTGSHVSGSSVNNTVYHTMITSNTSTNNTSNSSEEHKEKEPHGAPLLPPLTSVHTLKSHDNHSSNVTALPVINVDHNPPNSRIQPLNNPPSLMPQTHHSYTPSVGVAISSSALINAATPFSPPSPRVKLTARSDSKSDSKTGNMDDAQMSAKAAGVSPVLVNKHLAQAVNSHTSANFHTSTTNGDSPASSPSSANSITPHGSHRTSIAQYIDYERRHAQEQQYHLNKKRQYALQHTNTNTANSANTSPTTGTNAGNDNVIYLPRGGIYVHTPAGPIQFGMPPETIKDSMKLGLTLPTYFIVPKERFNLSAGINVAEFEFPAYYNFFFKRKRINLITTQRVEPLIRTIFTETLIGPIHVDWPKEYGENVPKDCYPDLKKEMSYFAVNPFDKSPLTVDSLLSFHYFDDSNKCVLDSGVSIIDLGEEYSVLVENEGSVTEIARVTSDVLCTPIIDDIPSTHTSANTTASTVAATNKRTSTLMVGDDASHSHHKPSSLDSLHTNTTTDTQPHSLPRASEMTAEHFAPPHFGITMLGNSDGFDSAGTTTGFVLWMNRRGIMVDPPPHSGALLKRHGISARLMRGVILTHCHADHDAGTFQKILEEGKVVLMTTEVILESFLRKYSAISGLEVEFLKKLFVFRPIIVGQRTAVYGGHLEFFYSLHSIPCVGFSAQCDGKSMVYSADSFNDPSGIEKLHQQGFISLGRKNKLINFPWHHDLILHEAGVPPIHTPLSTLEALPEPVKQRLYIVHKPSKDVPVKSGLQSALVGPENTLIIIPNDSRIHTSHSNSRALEILDLLSGIDLFSGFDLNNALEILQCANYLTFNKGETLISEGSYGDTMYVIAMGTVCVAQDGYALKSLTVGDHFGEMSIVTGEKRTASIQALTPVEVIQFTKQEFLYIVRNTDAIHRLKQLGVIQRSPSWQAISANSILVNLTSSQKTYLQSILQYRIVPAGEVLWHAGEIANEALLIADGSFHFSRSRDQVAPFKRGAFVGDMRALIHQTALTTTLICAEVGAVYAITRTNYIKFLDDNPGFKVLVMNRRFIE